MEERQHRHGAKDVPWERFYNYYCNSVELQEPDGINERKFSRKWQETQKKIFAGGREATLEHGRK
jgi:hypothetical protein